MAKKPGQPGYIRPNYTGTGLLHGSELGSGVFTTPVTPPTNAGGGQGRNYLGNGLSPGSQLGGVPTGAVVTHVPSIPAPAPPTPAAPAAPAPAPWDYHGDPTYMGQVAAGQAGLTRAIGTEEAKWTPLHQAQLAANYRDPVYGVAANQKYGMERLASMIASARHGGFYSSGLTNQLGTITGRYDTALADATTTAGNMAGTIGVDPNTGAPLTSSGGFAPPGTTIGALQAGEAGQETGWAADAIQRHAQAIAADPSTGGAAPPVTSTPAASPMPSAGAGTITTHIGGDFYKWYKNAYGVAPPLTVSVTAPRYIAWKAGIPAAKAPGRK